MNFDQHAFISYAHIDNEPLTPEQKGWVTQFHATLQTMLSQRLGERARIWRDDKLAGNDIFDAEIVDQLASTAMLISILSPRYLRSEWCTRELREFCDAAERHGGLTLANKSRVVKVVKTPIDASDALPPVVQRTLGHEFYSTDGDEPIEVDPAFGERSRELFLRKLSGLAFELAKTLKALMSPPVAGAVAAEARKAGVFLADCGRDLRDAREQLATDLRMHGHEVLPARQLPQTEEALVPELQAQLARCALAIHLVGRSAGAIPDGLSDRSAVMIANEVAAQRSRDGALRRIIWLPQGVTGERPEQQAFIDALQHDAALQAGADLLSGDLEALKGAIHLTLRQLEAAPPSPAAAATGKLVVHVLMNEADRVVAVPLIKLLRAADTEVTLPVFVGAAAELREANTQLATGCDALILFYGAGDEVWKFHQHSELRKLASAAGGALRGSEWLCLAPPASADKSLLQALGEPKLIDALGGWSQVALQPLLAELAATRRGP